MQNKRQMEQIHHLPRAPHAARAAVPTSRSLALPLASPSPSGAIVGVAGRTLPPAPSRVAPSVVVIVAARRRCHRRRQNRCSELLLKPQLSLPPIKIARRLRRRRPKMKQLRPVEGRISPQKLASVFLGECLAGGTRSKSREERKR